MMDTFRTPVVPGDIVAYVPGGSYKALELGIILTVTPKGNARIASTEDYIATGRVYFAKLSYGDLTEKNRIIIDKLRHKHGNTGD